MQIGIAPNDDAVAKFNEFKFNHKLYYVIYKIQGDKEIVVDKEGDKSTTFDVCPFYTLLILFIYTNSFFYYVCASSIHTNHYRI